MSRVSDLIDLIQTANDLFLMNAAQNVRSAYIVIDDLCELTIKSWLQLDTQQRQEHCMADLAAANICTSSNHRTAMRAFFAGQRTLPDLETSLGASAGALKATLGKTINQYQPVQNWTPNRDDGRFKSFPELIGEVRQLRPQADHSTLHEVLDRIQERRDNRNHFFHDPAQAGLTVDEKNCLRAFVDLYTLASLLLHAEFDNAVLANSVVLAQTAVIRMRLKRYSAQAAYDIYQSFLGSRGRLAVPYNGLAHEYCCIYEDPTRFLEGVHACFANQISLREEEVERINSLTRRCKRHQADLDRLKREITLYQEIMHECLKG